jgi:hypothetical protein
MNMSHIHESNRQLLLQSVILCQAINPYIQTLGLEEKGVASFKNEVQTALYITERYKSFANSFILYNIASLQRNLRALVHACLQSENYTKAIGKVLGIEEEIDFHAIAFRELDFYNNRQN